MLAEVIVTVFNRHNCSIKTGGEVTFKIRKKKVLVTIEI